MARLALALAALAAVLCVAHGTTMQRTLLTDYANAKCLDGTPSGYYIQESATGSTDWVVFLQGGGACETVSGCIQRSKTMLGSSKNWPATRVESNNLMSNNCSYNGGFCEFNHVWVPYCSGDVYVGMETKPGAIPLQFSGHLTVEAVIKDLTVNHGLGSGSSPRLLLSGSSAGGIGTFVNADFVTSLLPTVDVKAAPQGGFFFPNVTAFPYWLDGDFVYPENNTEIELFDAYLNPACVEEHGEVALCNDLFFLYPYITTPLFVAENQFDANQLFAQLHVPEKNTSIVRDYVSYFGEHMRSALSQVKAPNGLYAPSCVCHTSNLNMVASPEVNGYTMASALIDWYFKGDTVIAVESCADGSTLPCNPDCHCA